MLEKWKEYLDHLGTPQDAGWGERGNDRFIDLLFEMGSCVGYEFGKIELKRLSYFPVAHGEIDSDQITIRKALEEGVQFGCGNS